MKRILIIAGPNGAGKTTFAREYLPNEASCPEFVNADLIAEGLSPFNPDRVAMAAGRMMLHRLQQLVELGQNFAFETTLATRGFLRLIPDWQQQGYRIDLHFLQLPTPDFAVHRVARRVELGGHHIPTAIIERRFARGLQNLREHYLDLVDHWTIYDASTVPPKRLESGPDPHKLMEDPRPYPASDTDSESEDQEYANWLAGIDAAMRRASAKAIAEQRAAGLEPIVRKPDSQELGHTDPN